MPGLDYDPAVSPDGRWLVFSSERRGNPDLYVLDLQRGGEPRLLIDSDHMEDQASIFARWKVHLFRQYLFRERRYLPLPFRPDKTISMKEAENLTHHPGGDLRPSISPDGRMMAFSSDRDSPVTALARSPIRSGDIWTLNLFDRTLRSSRGQRHWLERLAEVVADGKEIVFYSSQFGSQWHAGNQSFQARRRGSWSADGTNPRAVTARKRQPFHRSSCRLDESFMRGGTSRTWKKSSW